ncbi:p23 [Pistachio virus X]|uniref:p23 n=1 Tax=Pistachio virus X TaxID=2794236 RepID=A0A7T0M809_9VIRU|nr:p23 [Pistachio virus X]
MSSTSEDAVVPTVDTDIFSVSLEGLPRSFYDDIVSRYSNFVVSSERVVGLETDFDEPSMLHLDPVNPCTSFKALCVCSGVLPDFRALIHVHVCDHYPSSKRVKSVVVNVLPSCSDFDSVIRLTFPDVPGAFSFHACRAKAIAAKWPAIVAYFSSLKQAFAKENAKSVQPKHTVSREPVVDSSSSTSAITREPPIRGRGRGSRRGRLAY